MQTFDSAIRKVLWKIGYDFHQFDPNLSIDLYLRSLFQSTQTNMVIDVGAREGEYGKSLRAFGYTGIIHSFEPVSRNFEALRSVTASDNNWHIHQVALGAEAGELEIHVSEETHFSSFLNLSRFGQDISPRTGIVATEKVPVHRLDSYFTQLAKPTGAPKVHLKLDTQGWDIEVLKGASGCLEPVATGQTEISFRALYDAMPNWSQSVAELEARGFSPMAFFPVLTFPNGALIESDCIFVKTPPPTTS